MTGSAFVPHQSWVSGQTGAMWSPGRSILAGFQHLWPAPACSHRPPFAQVCVLGLSFIQQTSTEQPFCTSLRAGGGLPPTASRLMMEMLLGSGMLRALTRALGKACESSHPGAAKDGSGCGLQPPANCLTLLLTGPHPVWCPALGAFAHFP